MAEQVIRHLTRTELADVDDDGLIKYAELLIEQYSRPGTKNAPAARCIRELVHRLNARRWAESHDVDMGGD